MASMGSVLLCFVDCYLTTIQIRRMYLPNVLAKIYSRVHGYGVKFQKVFRQK